jgi:hypothetical protein
MASAFQAFQISRSSISSGIKLRQIIQIVNANAKKASIAAGRTRDAGAAVLPCERLENIFQTLKTLGRARISAIGPAEAWPCEK